MNSNWTEISNHNIAKEIGGALQTMRLRLNLSQRELAIRAGISLPTLNRIESGNANPSLSVLLAILKALGRIEELRSVFTLEPSPMLLATGSSGEKRRRASGKERRSTESRQTNSLEEPKAWTWGDDE